jgi:hypothetical protein
VHSILGEKLVAREALRVVCDRAQAELAYEILDMGRDTAKDLPVGEDDITGRSHEQA